MVGVCFGHQIVAEALGGKVNKLKHREAGTWTGWTEHKLQWLIPFCLKTHQVIQNPNGLTVGRREFAQQGEDPVAGKPVSSLYYYHADIVAETPPGAFCIIVCA